MYKSQSVFFGHLAAISRWSNCTLVIKAFSKHFANPQRHKHRKPMAPMYFGCSHICKLCSGEGNPKRLNTHPFIVYRSKLPSQVTLLYALCLTTQFTTNVFWAQRVSHKTPSGTVQQSRPNLRPPGTVLWQFMGSPAKPYMHHAD